MSKEISPDSMIDREVQQEHFQRMLQFEDSARLLVICDKADTGKSTLLRRLEYNCSYIERVFVSLIPLDEEMTYCNAFTLTKGVREKLRPSTFERFDRFESARVNFDFAPFAQSQAMLIGGVAATTITGGTVGGVVSQYQYKIQHVEKLDFTKATGWPNPEMEEIARQRCIEAFLEDLKELSNSQPVVLLIDSWDERRGNAGLKGWILRHLIHPHCFDLCNRPTKFVIVIAGQKVPDFKLMLKENYSTLVKLSGMSAWEKSHVRDFLKLHGFGGLTEDLFDSVFLQVQRGMPVGSALKMANLFKEAYNL